MAKREEEHEYPALVERSVNSADIAVEQKCLEGMDDRHRRIAPQRRKVAGAHSDIINDKIEEQGTYEEGLEPYRGNMFFNRPNGQPKQNNNPDRNQTYY